MFFAIFQPATEYTAIIERSRGDVTLLLKTWLALINWSCQVYDIFWRYQTKIWGWWVYGGCSSEYNLGLARDQFTTKYCITIIDTLQQENYVQFITVPIQTNVAI